MNARVLAALPDDEFRLVEGAIGRTCTCLELFHMCDADAPFAKPARSGLHEVTWAVLLHLADGTRGGSLCVTWEQDALGNPNRLSLAERPRLLAVDSVAVQDISAYSPWSSIIGQRCAAIRPYTYRTNYARHPSAGTWHEVLWGLEFTFPGLAFLVAAALHGSADRDPTANDELVLAYTSTAIGRLVALHDNYEEAWGDA